MGNELNRRELFGHVTTVATSVALLAISAKLIGADSKGAGALKLVPDTDPTAKALKYVHDGSKADRPKKGAVEGKDQSCKNCQMYTKRGELDRAEIGKCLMIAGGDVKATGWCMSWVKKA